MNKEIISEITKSAILFRQQIQQFTAESLSQHVINVLPALLEFDEHPTQEEEEAGKGECTTSYKYFVSVMGEVQRGMSISPRIVQRSLWEPSGKRASIHMIAQANNEKDHFIIDPTHFMGPGFGQVHNELFLHTTLPLTERDLRIIDRIKTAKHLYSINSPQADFEATQILSLQMPPYIDSWKADLLLMMVNNRVGQGMLQESLEGLRKVTDLNPYKAGILRTAERITHVIDEAERLDGIRSLLNLNMERLTSSARAIASDFYLQSRQEFLEGDLKKGLMFLRLAWWVDNIAQPKLFPTITLDGKEFPITKLTPLEFNRLNLVNLWITKDSSRELSKHFEIAFQAEAALHSQTEYGYSPIELSFPQDDYTEKETPMWIFILKPRNTFTNIDQIGKIPGIRKIDKGIRGLLNSVGVLYPHLTNVDKFNLISYQLLERENG